VGLALSFIVIGLFVATIGFAAGLDQDLFRYGAALLMIIVGIGLLIPSMQVRLATTAGPIGNWAQGHAQSISTQGLRGQFLVGVLLGAVWSPCVGPTLGAASVLAARAQNLFSVAIVMAAFGLGAALPLLLIGMLSREALLRWRDRILSAGQGGKAVMGVLMLLLGGLILTGLDKRAEAALVDVSPAWLTELTTRF
jgi:cytochrome c biogenesis protein CcdA